MKGGPNMATRFTLMRTVAASTCLAVLAIVGCSKREPEQTVRTGYEPSICVVNYPLQYFVERIGENRVLVCFPAPRDVDPAFWRPGEYEIMRFQAADRILLNGEHRRSLPGVLVVIFGVTVRRGRFRC